MNKTPIPPIKEFGETAPVNNPAAMTAYRCSLYGLLPVVAIPLAPIAIRYALAAFRAYRANPKVGGQGQALVSIILAVASFVSNLLGLALIAYGQGWLGG
jgi:hypothetical protein